MFNFFLYGYARYQYLKKKRKRFKATNMHVPVYIEFDTIITMLGVLDYLNVYTDITGNL